MEQSWLVACGVLVMAAREAYVRYLFGRGTPFDWRRAWIVSSACYAVCALTIWLGTVLVAPVTTNTHPSSRALMIGFSVALMVLVLLALVPLTYLYYAALYRRAPGGRRGAP